MTALEVLEAHTPNANRRTGGYECPCGWGAGMAKYGPTAHQRHLAQMLDQHMQERQRRAWSTGFHKGRKTENGSHISAWPKNPYRKEINHEQQ